MSDQIKSLITTARAFRFAILWFFLFSVNALCTSIMGALTGAEWNELDAQSKFMIIIAILGNWTNVILAFMSKAAKKMESGSLNFDDTTQITKPTTQ